MSRLRIGTRRSALAMAQAELVAERLRAAGAPVDLVDVSTAGDRSSAPVAELGVGVFISALRDALAAARSTSRCTPTRTCPPRRTRGCALAAVPQAGGPAGRAGRPGRAWCSASCRPARAVGTGSPRRPRSCDALGLGLEVVPIRGNVDTRIGKVRAGELDAVVVAPPGWTGWAGSTRSPSCSTRCRCCRRPAQGALAVECRAGDADPS